MENILLNAVKIRHTVWGTGLGVKINFENLS